MHQIGGLRGRTGSEIQTTEHWEGATVAGEPASVRLCSNVSNYWVRPAIDDAYGLRAVPLERLPPLGRYAFAHNEAGPRRGVDSSILSIVIGLSSSTTV